MPPSDTIYDLQERLEAAECAYSGSREKNRQLAKRLADIQAQLEKAETEANEGFVEAYEKGAHYGRLDGAERQLEAMEEAMKKLKQAEKQRDEWERKYWDLHNGVGGLLGSQQSIEAGESVMKLEVMNTAPRKSAPAQPQQYKQAQNCSIRHRHRKLFRGVRLRSVNGKRHEERKHMLV